MKSKRPLPKFDQSRRYSDPEEEEEDPSLSGGLPADSWERGTSRTDSEGEEEEEEDALDDEEQDEGEEDEEDDARQPEQEQEQDSSSEYTESDDDLSLDRSRTSGGAPSLSPAASGRSKGRISWVFQFEISKANRPRSSIDREIVNWLQRDLDSANYTVRREDRGTKKWGGWTFKDVCGSLCFERFALYAEYIFCFVFVIGIPHEGKCSDYHSSQVSIGAQMRMRQSGQSHRECAFHYSLPAWDPYAVKS